MLLLFMLNVAVAQRADGQPEMPKPPGMCDAEDALTKDPKGEYVHIFLSFPKYIQKSLGLRERETRVDESDIACVADFTQVLGSECWCRPWRLQVS